MTVTPAEPVNPLTGIPDRAATPLERDARDALRRIDLDVIGKHRNCKKYDVYSPHVGASAIDDINRFSYCNLIEVAGGLVKRHIHRATRRWRARSPTTKSKKPSPSSAACRPLDEQPALGQGCWAVDGGILIVNGRQAGFYRDGDLRTFTSPRFGTRVLDFSGKPWLDFGRLADYLERASDHEWVRESPPGPTVELFGKWNWKHSIDATVAAALAACSPLQAAWEYRPEVAIAAASGSGKSWFFKRLLAKLFGGLAWLSNKPTEAGIQQHVGSSTSLVIMLDEFEEDELAAESPLGAPARSARRGRRPPGQLRPEGAAIPPCTTSRGSRPSRPASLSRPTATAASSWT